MLEGPMLKVFPPVVPPQLSDGVFDPLTVMVVVDPELVSVAVPFIAQLVVRGPPVQVPVALSVAVSLVGVKTILPEVRAVVPQEKK